MDMLDFHNYLPQLIALGQVILIDLILAGDNAIVVGMAAAALPRNQRRRVIFIGIAAATVLRILFALVTNHLLAIIGLTLAGGLLLLWVCWKFWRELEHQRRTAKLQKAQSHKGHGARKDAESLEEALPGAAPGKTMRQAIIQIIMADVSMSLDNVLAVAGAARDHAWVMAFGLFLSVALMGAAASFIANLLKRFPWIAYLGLAIILYVAMKMIYDGWAEVAAAAAQAGFF